ncbi:MFS transporter [Streptomyces javensis]|uniref:MFS transporter n=1 Tax=Streptomyces javensis TaxID=114698 RepID=UPI00340911AF
MDLERVSKGRVLLAVALAQFLVMLVMSIVNVALPAIQTGLDFEPDQLQWVVNSYALTFGGLLLLGGRAADVFGQRRLLVGGTVLFAVASLVGGLAQNDVQLLAARVVQGAGAAAMAPAALALLTTTHRDGAERTKAFGVYAGVSAVGGTFGVLLGGLLTEYFGWRWIMLVNVPMALVVIWLAMRHVPAGIVGDRRRLDVLGGILATLGVSLLVFGVVRTTDYAWTSGTTLTTLAGALLLIVAFVAVEGRAKSDPLLRLGLLAKRSVGGANIFMLFLCAGQFAAFYFIALYLQQVLDMKPAVAGTAFLPFCFGVIAGTVVSTRLVSRLGVKALLVPGGLIGAAGFGWFATLEVSGSFAVDVLGPSLVAGFGIGVCFVPLTGAATGGLPPHEAGMASAVLNSSRQIGGAIGLAAVVTLQTQRTNSRLADGDSLKEAMTSGFSLGLAISGGILVVAALTAVLILPTGDRSASSEPAGGAVVRGTGLRDDGSPASAEAREVRG